MQEGIIIHGDKINIGHPHPPSYQTCNHRHQWVYYCNHTQHKCLIMGNSKLVQLLSVIFIFTCRICNLLILIKSKKVVRLLELFIVIKQLLLYFITILMVSVNITKFHTYSLNQTQYIQSCGKVCCILQCSATLQNTTNLSLQLYKVHTNCKLNIYSCDGII